MFLRRSLFFIFVSLVPPVALCHGPIPAGVDVLLSDSSGGAAVVQLNRGSAVRLDGTWHYLCSALWGGPDAPLMMSPDGENVLIAALDGLFMLDRSGRVTDLASAQLTSGSTRHLLAIDGKAYALTGFSGGSTVWRVDVDSGVATVVPVFESERTIKALGVTNEMLLVGYTTDDKSLELLTVDLDGQAVGLPRVIPGPIEGSLFFETVEDTLYVRLLASNRYRLLRVDTDSMTELADSALPIHGPVAKDGLRLVSVDGRLSGLQGDVITPLDDDATVSCLRSRMGHGPFSCVLPDIFEVSPKTDASPGGFGPALFVLDQLKPPKYDDLEPMVAANCELGWSDFGRDALLVAQMNPFAADPGPEPSDVSPPAPDATETPVTDTGSCGVAQSSSPVTPVGMLILATALFLAYRQSRRRA